MNIVSLRDRSRSLVRDLSGVYFNESDLRNYANEGIDRMKQVIPELKGMKHLYAPSDEITLIPEEWHHLLAIYCASRLCSQDERFYQAGTFMNEFESKLLNLKSAHEAGDVEFIDPVTGLPVESGKRPENVKNVYYFNHSGVIPKYFDEEEDW